MVDPLLIVERNSFANAWARVCIDVMQNGEEFEFGGKIKGKEQYEKKSAKGLESVIQLEESALREAIGGVLHPQFPTKEKHKKVYISEWCRGFDWKAQGFTYCYENRCEEYEAVNYDKNYSLEPIEYIDQWKIALEDVMNQIDNRIQSNRNCIVIPNVYIDRFKIPDSPPCLREIWIRWNGKNGIDIKTTWRSRDLYGAWMTNITGLLSAVTREIINPLITKYNKIYRISSYSENVKSLHIYEYDWDDALKVKKLAVNPQIMH